MKKILIALTFITLLLMLSSCKKRKASEENNEAIKKIYLPVKFECTSFSFSLKYKAGTNLLTEINASDGNKILITYTSEQLPLKLEKYENSKLSKLIDYYKDEQKRIKQCTSFYYDANTRAYIPLGDINIDYDVKGRIANLRCYTDLNILFKEHGLTYDLGGNLSSTALIDHNIGNNKLSYTFDKQMGIYMEVPYTSLFAIELENYFFNCKNNNVATFADQKNGLEDAIYSYEYNQEGYPTLMKVSKNKTTLTFKITYMEFAN